MSGMFDHATVGLGVAAGSVSFNPSAQQVRRPTPQVAVGFTTPSVIYEKMRQIQASAAALDGDVAANVRRDGFKAAWTAWFSTWGAFFRKHQETFQRLANVANTDELNAQTDSYRQQLMNWYDAYTREQDPSSGQPVPPPSGQPPTPAPAQVEPGAGTDGFTVPWWVWTLGGVALVGLGYWAYRSVTENVRILNARKEALETRVLPGLIGPDLAAAAAARDMGAYPYAVPVARDPGYLQGSAVHGGAVGYVPRFMHEERRY